MSDQIILRSVGSYLDTGGHVGPLNANGLPDLSTGSAVDLSDVDAEWLAALSAEDSGTVSFWLRDLGLAPTSESDARAEQCDEHGHAEESGRFTPEAEQ